MASPPATIEDGLFPTWPRDRPADEGWISPARNTLRT